MSKRIRLTMAQAVVRYLAAQRSEIDGKDVPLIAGAFAIFGHGNVAGLGEALAAAEDALPTYRAHNEQAMALAAIAFAKAKNRRQLMACTTSIGPGATNMVTAAAVAHVDRLPVLLLPGDIFASRLPDPVLQQIEVFGDPSISVNDCFRPVSRFWDRIMRPEQLLQSLPQAIRTLTDPADCGPVTLAMPQDVQTHAYDFPAEFFETRHHRRRRPAPDAREVADAAAALRAAKRPMVIVGGGVHYSEAVAELKQFLTKHGLMAGETQAGKGALTWDDPHNLGSVGVTGSSAANTLAADADLVLAIGTRLQDFTTGSWNLFKARPKLIQLNVAPYDAWKHNALPLIGDARVTLPLLSAALGDWKVPAERAAHGTAEIARWRGAVDAATAAPKQSNALPSDAQVLGAANRKSAPSDIMVCAAGGLPGELHKLWKTRDPKGYHLEYGYSCMGYEIAGGVGVKLAHPERRVIVLVGDGSYLMMNSEIATSVMLGAKLDIVVLDNRGYGCINRLQQACGGRPFNNLLVDARHKTDVKVDFAAHAASLGAIGEKVANVAELESALDRAKTSDRTHVIVIDTDPMITTQEGGAWWEVPVPEVSTRSEVGKARANYEKQVAARAGES
ncbi:MAG TPA: 3D-(3,5/4)-trihydroxycyclohexane-1,2-dione acylhydrolase (decyclizing) [Candidatus Cybelea sp.]|nr:3D-(3,5/4)-trihydroxycyclohexane-1,2-dione acylhydrolase (decyclizing) [Candidatus Cybelea sp.]